jgi:hypothetical protein
MPYKLNVLTTVLFHDKLPTKSFIALIQSSPRFSHLHKSRVTIHSSPSFRRWRGVDRNPWFVKMRFSKICNKSLLNGDIYQFTPWTMLHLSAQNTVNQLLLVWENIWRGSWKPSSREYFTLRTKYCIAAYTNEECSIMNQFATGKLRNKVAANKLVYSVCAVCVG